mgnify:CR=1 FL=1
MWCLIIYHLLLSISPSLKKSGFVNRSLCHIYRGIRTSRCNIEDEPYLRLVEEALYDLAIAPTRRIKGLLNQYCNHCTHRIAKTNCCWQKCKTYHELTGKSIRLASFRVDRFDKKAKRVIHHPNA